MELAEAKRGRRALVNLPAENHEEVMVFLALRLTAETIHGLGGGGWEYDNYGGSNA